MVEIRSQNENDCKQTAYRCNTNFPGRKRNIFKTVCVLSSKSVVYCHFFY